VSLSKLALQERLDGIGRMKRERAGESA